MKKEGGTIYNEATELLKRAQGFSKEALVGVDKADWKPKREYPNLPFALGLFTDIHYGSIYTDYDLLNKHLQTVEDTPNFGMISNGDDIDNFAAMGKIASGTFENPLPPQLQTVAFMDKLKTLNKKDKLGLMSYGNHNSFGDVTGYDWLETWATKLPKPMPIFTSGGLLTLDLGKEKYKIAVSHRFWGNSKVNPTNANKRLLDYEYPDADVLFLGHTHVSEMDIFERAGKEKIAAIGGTYKKNEPYSRQKGIGTHSGEPGLTIVFYPNEHRMIGFKNQENAQQFMLSLIYREEQEHGLTPKDLKKLDVIRTELRNISQNQ